MTLPQQYVLGDIRAMSEGKDDHNAIASNLVHVLGSVLLSGGSIIWARLTSSPTRC